MILAALHGEGLDLIYFWSSILIVALPLTIFSVLTYFVIKGYLKRPRKSGPN